jgi:hypothetical protein
MSISFNVWHHIAVELLSGAHIPSLRGIYSNDINMDQDGCKEYQSRVNRPGFRTFWHCILRYF